MENFKYRGPIHIELSYNAILGYSGYSSTESNSFIQPRMHLRL